MTPLPPLYSSSHKVTGNSRLTMAIWRIFWFKLHVSVLWDIWLPFNLRAASKMGSMSSINGLILLIVILH
jgi:hypothetical protein